MTDNIRVLLVDDEPDFIEMTAKRLARRGFIVEQAGDCGEGLARLAAAPVDVVVLDVMLPDLDGVQCLRKMKESWPAVAVILLTGHASIPAGLQSVEFGANDYCLKPIEFEELVEKIQIAYAENRGLCNNISKTE